MSKYYVVVAVLAAFAQLAVSGGSSQALAGPQTEPGQGQAKEEAKAQAKPQPQANPSEPEAQATPQSTASPSHPQPGSPYRVDYAHGYYYYTTQSGWVWVYQNQSHITSRTSYYQPTTSSYSYPSYQPAPSFGGTYCRT